MADLALLDSGGRLRLGRCGVELWFGSDGCSANLHFLMDQLPPSRQSLWDNAVTVRWGPPEAGGGGAGGAAAGAAAAGGEGGDAGGGGLEGVIGVAGAAGAEAGGTGGGAGAAIDGPGGGGAGDPWVSVSLSMPLRNFELLIAGDEG
ncbi:hypothetical protein GPECTOR_185g279 [Gonium pectorale]|uniref:Uncharacterized protein n=1 Tax=Gonium pectorale TaxID=33097 RepID=A0A150FX67_GONPE|nr:hypothetical protein GPECTOR_185g279 [Gonium pectorale]|eukprot:KXZ42196.1 hypothetical protein GPECTOR_185g279 [Gonium pectorale]